MARRIGIELVATAEQARQVLRAFSQDIRALEAQSNSLTVAASKLQRAQFAGTKLGGFNADGSLTGGLYLNKPRQEYLAAANTIKVVTDATLRLANGQEVLRTSTTTYTADLNKLLTAQQNYDSVIKQTSQDARSYATQINQIRQAYLGVTQAANSAAAAARQRISIGQGRIATADATVAAATLTRDRTQIAAQTAQAAVGPAFQAYAAGSISQQRLIEIQQQAARRQQEFIAAQQSLTSVTAAASKERTNANKQIQRATAAEIAAQNRLTNEFNNTRTAMQAARSQFIRANVPRLQAADAAVQAAFNAAPPLPPALATVQRESPALLNLLRRAGLGGGAAPGTEAFSRSLIDQKAIESFDVQRDLVRNVTRVSGSFLDQKGVVQSLSAEYDKSGRVITRFGSHLSGLGNVLSQIGRDFQKVIEFAIATTVVFGTLRFAIDELRTITEIDKSLRQFGITANLTREETAGLFEDLSRVAVSTATPLTEVVKAADDIALATREAGKSTQQWHSDIISLTESVGILTNLAGIDTVQATDLLVSTMKQLNLEADELPSILNKITAVAGGQSTAIGDIIQGLGVMAEAGAQAGLTIDQQIAAVQTLSQVTAKSPSEVATAFKNLVGSLGGRAALKQLELYDIKVRDTAGNLRNIIDIYGEINDKIASGIIPADRVQEVVRGIAGGPRRAPDAAALLGAIEDISQVTRTSFNATNEALIANAKILDSTQAKFTQLRARLDSFATVKFADILNKSVGALAETLDRVLDFLEAIPSEAYVMVIQFGLMAGAIKFTGTVLGFLINSFTGLLAQLKLIPGALASASGGLLAFGRTAQTVSPILGPNGQPIVKNTRNLGIGTGLRTLGAGAAIGVGTAGLAAASGADPLNAIATGLQTAGITGLIAAPGPFKLLGAAATLAGFALQFFASQEKEVEDASKSSTEALLNAIGAYKTINDSLEGITDNRRELASSIDRLQAQENLTLEESEQLLNFQRQYGENTVELISANQALAESFADLREHLGGINEEWAQGFQVAAAQAGRLTDDQLRQLTQELAPEILRATNPNFIAPEDFILPTPTLGGLGPTEGPTTATKTTVIPATTQFIPSFGGGPSSFQTLPEEIKTVNINLEELQGNVDLIRSLFNETGTSIEAAFAATPKNLDLVAASLESIKDKIDPSEYERLKSTFQSYAAEVNALFAAERNVALYKSYLEAGGATGLFTPEEVRNGQAILDLYLQLINLAPQLPTTSPILPRDGEITVDSDRVSSQDIIQQATDFAFPEGKIRTTAPSKEEAAAFGESILLAVGAIDDLEKRGATLEYIKALFTAAKIEVEGLNDGLVQTANSAAAANAELIDALEGFQTEAISNASQELANLQAQFQGGEFSDNPEVYQRQVEQLNAIIETAQQVGDAYINLADTLDGSVDVEMQAFAASLTHINGLQDAESLSTDQLISRLFTLADTYGLTAEQVVDLGTKMVGLIELIKRISEIKATFKIGAEVDLAGAIRALEALYSASLITAQRKARLYGEPELAVGDQSILDAIAELKAAQASISGVGSAVGGIYQGGGGTSFYKPPTKGKTPKTPKGPDVSTIDIPDAIANAYNRDALIQEAIRRAKALQAKIPGYAAEAKNDIVELLKGTQHILEVRGIKDDLLRKALEELAEIEKKRLDFETKADTIRRIRVGSGSFAAIANVPVNAQTGVSVGAGNAVNVTLNINGTVLTPAQLAQFADQVAAAIKRQIANS